MERHCILKLPLHLLKKKYVVENIAKLGYTLLSGILPWKETLKHEKDKWRKAVTSVSGKPGDDNPGRALFRCIGPASPEAWDRLELKAQYLWDTTARAMRLYLFRGGCLVRDRKV